LFTTRVSFISEDICSEVFVSSHSYDLAILSAIVIALVDRR